MDSVIDVDKIKKTYRKIIKTNFFKDLFMPNL